MKKLTLLVLIFLSLLTSAVAENITVHLGNGQTVTGIVDQRTGTIMLNNQDTGASTWGMQDRLGNVTVYESPRLDQRVPTPNLDALLRDMED